ncbi:GIN domain-containing protein [Photobacterium sp. 53610]|uniref:GIN domain-containing protein n=1 Tax=Photobacterium sp. 53610 TaxID=3102789 RepID=UPI002ED7B4FC
MNIKSISFLSVCLISSSFTFATETTVPVCDYTRLTINVPSTVKLIASGDSSGTVKGATKELDALKYTCANGKFEISTEDAVGIKEGLIFELTNGSVSSLTLNGAQTVDITNLAAKNFTLVVNGAGTSNLFGKVGEFSVSLNGAANVEATSLESQIGKIQVNGSGSVRLNVSSELTGKLNGSGRIEYLGTPQTIDTKINGSGSISTILVSPKI